MSIFSHRKRSFLCSISTGHTSYILTEIESSRAGEYKWGTCMLTMADCRRRIQLEFFLGTKRARRESLRKIDLLIKQLEGFRTQLRKEAGLITQYEQKQKESKRRKKGHGKTNSKEIAKK
jgi:hypothetical protein